MRWPALLFPIAFSGIAAAAIGGFLAVLILAVASTGPEGILEGLFFGLFGAAYAVPVASVPAMILGALLLRLGVRNLGIWSLVGALTGVVCLALAHYFPGVVGDVAVYFSEPPATRSGVWIAETSVIRLGAVFAIAGALAALFFRKLVGSFLDDDEPAVAD